MSEKDETERPRELRSTYDQILKSSALIGGSSLLVIAIGIVRTKIMALILGPAGYGLMSVYTSIVDLAVGIVGLGVSSSGIRQIAEAVGNSDGSRVATIAMVLRRTTFYLGLIGALLLAVCASQISFATFGDEQYSFPIRLLALAVLFRLVSSGQGALLQGMRRIRDLAIVGALGALIGSVLSVALIALMGTSGVAPSVVVVSLVALLVSWFYSRRIAISGPRLNRAEVRSEVTSLLRLGIAFMVSGLLMMGAAYVIRTMILRVSGLDAAGHYQAAWALGGLYIGMILQAMGSDFYPRLAAVSTDDERTNRFVNEQAQVSLLLAGPGVLATMTVAPLLMTVFYSAAFVDASELLRWMCLGMALRVVTWPMGFIIVARSEQRIYLATELAWAIVYVGLSWLFLKNYGLSGAGIAFFGSYVFHGLIIYPAVRKISGFSWSTRNLRTLVAFGAVIGGVFLGFHLLPMRLAAALGATLTVASVYYSTKTILVLVPVERLPPPIRKLFTFFRLSARPSP